MEVAGNCLQWQQSPSVPHFRRLPHPSRSLSRIHSLDRLHKTHRTSLTRSLSAGFTNDGESVEDFVKRIQQLALKVNHQTESTPLEVDDPGGSEETTTTTTTASSVVSFSAEPPWPAVRPERRNDDLVIPSSVEQAANRIRGLPLSIQIIKKKKKKKKKKKREENLSGVESAVKKAFSSMVFIVQELQSHTLQMREVLFYEDLQGVLARVQEEMSASFVWLFQRIFSCTPTLMVYVMLLLANFTVHSISSGSALAAPVSIPQSSVLGVVERNYKQEQNTGIDSAAAAATATATATAIETFDIRKTASVNGGDGGSGRTRLVAAGGTDDGSYYNGGGGGVVAPDEEVVVWNRMVEEVARMRAGEREEALMDRDTLRSLVAPVKVDAVPDDYEEHLRTETMYHRALALDPENTLLLSNFAQFLYLVLHDHDRAEYYFKRAVGIKPADAESLSRYASFLWLVRKDLGAAEETYLEAIAAEPSNSYYAANYAHFLWNTGGEDTCYPLDGGDDAC